MNFTNINDPAGVKALLDQLRVSQAWQAVSSHSETPSSGSGEQLVSTIAAAADSSTPTSSTSVTSLLSQLQPSPWIAPTSTHITESDSGRTAAPVFLPEATLNIAQVPTPKKNQDIATYTFQQALPHIAQLANDSEFVAAIRQMKKDQDDIERQLWEDRRQIYRKYEEKVKIATTKANMIGDSGLSKHEADMLQTGLRKELENFDRNRVLVAWDGLISKQQVALAHRGVPTMFSTSEVIDRERQQRVMQVLEGIV